MATTKKTSVKKTVAKNSPIPDQRTLLATNAASAITDAISRSYKASRGKGNDGKITVNVHVGDIIMMGFDEAIDAEEWGMRENNTEIIDGSGKTGKSRRGTKAEPVDPDANRKITREIKLRKGSLEFNAREDSAPAAEKSVKKVARKSSVKRGPSTKKTVRKSVRK